MEFTEFSLHTNLQKGIEQAEKTRDILKDIKFDLIISSPLIRTKHTMEIININK